MKKAILSVVLTGLMSVGAAQAQSAPAGAPAGANGICRDGSYSTAANKSGACQGHKGVQTWYAASGDVKAAPSGSTAQSAAQNAPAASPSKPTARQGPAAAAAAKTAQPGGGPGMVWVNTKSNVYHCYGTTYYGKTKEGSYMSEPDARAKGAHGVSGKSCSN